MDLLLFSPDLSRPCLALAKSATRSSGSTIMRWQSSGLSVMGRSASTTWSKEAHRLHQPGFFHSKVNIC